MLAVAALGVIVPLVGLLALWLGWRQGLLRGGLLVSALLILALVLFLPSTAWQEMLGPRGLAWLNAMARVLPGELGEIVHFAGFLGLAFLLWILRSDLRRWQVPALLVVMAALSELLQGLVPTRSVRLADVWMNLAGAGVGVLVGATVCGLMRAGRGLRAAPAQAQDAASS